MSKKNTKDGKAAAVRCPDPKTLVSEETFRHSGSGLNKTDGMVRVTLEMPIKVWWARKHTILGPYVKPDKDDQ